MKHIIVLFTLGTIAYTTVRIGDALSPDALALALGLLLGVLAGIPAALLVLAAQRQAHREPRGRQIGYTPYRILQSPDDEWEIGASARILTTSEAPLRQWEKCE